MIVENKLTHRTYCFSPEQWQKIIAMGDHVKFKILNADAHAGKQPITTPIQVFDMLNKNKKIKKSKNINPKPIHNE